MGGVSPAISQGAQCEPGCVGVNPRGWRARQRHSAVQRSRCPSQRRNRPARLSGGSRSPWAYVEDDPIRENRTQGWMKRPPFGMEAQYEIPVEVPFRLDFTVSVLRRLSTNIVDVLIVEGDYVRALSQDHEPVVACVTQERPDTLTAPFEGGASGSRGHHLALATVKRMLGVERDLSCFDRAAKDIPWLAPLAIRMRGVK